MASQSMFGFGNGGEKRFRVRRNKGRGSSLSPGEGGNLDSIHVGFGADGVVGPGGLVREQTAARVIGVIGLGGLDILAPDQRFEVPFDGARKAISRLGNGRIQTFPIVAADEPEVEKRLDVGVKLGFRTRMRSGERRNQGRAVDRKRQIEDPLGNFDVVSLQEPDESRFPARNKRGRRSPARPCKPERH